MNWARRLKRVFGLEIEQCVRCGGRLRVIASIEQPELIERILAHRRERGEEDVPTAPLWGTLKGVGKVYVQVVIDVFCSPAFAKVYTAKMPVTAADLLYDRVLPFYQALGVQVGAMLTDNGREFCGLPDQHPYELLLDECFRVQGRQTWYIGVDEIQRDLDRFLRYYNLERSHQGYRLKGRTPAQALMEALGVTEIPDIIPTEEVNEPLPTAA